MQNWSHLTQSRIRKHCLFFTPVCVEFIKTHRQKYDFECTVEARKFLQWAPGELRKIKYGLTKRSSGKDHTFLFKKDIPAAYHRLVCQLTAEIIHATHHTGHEALRRCSYAMEILDAFGAELSSVRVVTADFRSKVLTPILQRQLRGIPDYYTPGVSNAVASDGEMVTISDATKFYLEDDPTDPECIPSYRRNLIYIPEARWHLGYVLGNIKLGSGPQYDRIRTHQDDLMKALREDREEEIDDDDSNVPEFISAEVTVLVQEGLDDYFAQELVDSVCINSSYPPPTSHYPWATARIA